MFLLTFPFKTVVFHLAELCETRSTLSQKVKACHTQYPQGALHSPWEHLKAGIGKSPTYNDYVHAH